MKVNRTYLLEVTAFFKNWQSLVVISVSVLIGLFCPDDILDEYYGLKYFVMEVSKSFPVIENYAAKSEFPQVSALYFSLVGLLTPLLLFWVIRNRDIWSERLLEKKRARPFSWMLSVTVLSAIASFGLLFSYLYNPGYDFQVAPVNSSRVALSLFGWLLVGGASFMVLGFVVINLLLIKSRK